jgi:gamma-glutamyl-gamma-aminobutyrate hydrolase PuuD
VRPLLVTQRIDPHEKTGELREALDVRWSDFLARVGFFPIPVPSGASLEEFLAAVSKPAGILLTGGNTVAGLDAASQRRDAVERELLRRMPKARVLGVCHGLQALVVHAGGSLGAISGHVRQRHAITVGESRWLSAHAGLEVNSYHGDGIADPGSMTVAARAQDGSIEAAESGSRLGIMWHPERELPFRKEDLDLFRTFFA